MQQDKQRDRRGQSLTEGQTEPGSQIHTSPKKLSDWLTGSHADIRTRAETYRLTKRRADANILRDWVEEKPSWYHLGVILGPLALERSASSSALVKGMQQQQQQQQWAWTGNAFVLAYRLFASKQHLNWGTGSRSNWSTILAILEHPVETTKVPSASWLLRSSQNVCAGPVRHFGLLFQNLLRLDKTTKLIRSVKLLA